MERIKTNVKGFFQFRPKRKETVSNDSTSIRFQVSDKTPQEVKLKWTNPSQHIITEHRQYLKNNCSRVLQGTSFPSGRIHCQNNGFVHSVVEAYNHHHNIVIRPDDVWIAIAIQFSYYVNANSEEFRNKFVNFEGKKTLAVQIPGTLDSAPYDQFVELMTNEIDKNLIDDEVKNFILPNFTTSTQDDYVTAGVVLMATMKKYFEYRPTVMCGIPSVTLEGTIEDWIKIQEKLKKLKTYNLQEWVEGMLEPILKQFINAKKGKVNKVFWQMICDYRGDLLSGSDYLSGWITAFTVFDENGKWQGNVQKERKWPWIDFQNVPSGTVEVDVTINDNGMKEYKAIMFAGHMATEVLEDGCTIQPRSGWVMVLKDSENISENPTE